MDEAKKYMLVAILCDFATDYEHKFYPTTPIRHANDLHDFVNYWIEINENYLTDIGLKYDDRTNALACAKVYD